MSEPLIYQVENIKTTIVNNEEDASKLSLTLEIDTTDRDRAKFIAETELARIANLLSWEKSVPVTNPQVNSMDYFTDKGKRNAVIIAATGAFRVKFSMNLSLSKQSIESLSGKLSSDIAVPEDVQIMWREAISEPSKSLQFLLYFRILEKIKDSDKSVDEYIRYLQPDVVLCKDGHGDKDVSLYKFLRDNIHAKTASYPYEEIENNLHPISNLVRTAIENKYSGNSE